MAHPKPRIDSECPVEHVLALIGGKWKPMIIYHLLNGTLRFSEIRKRIPQATQQMLTLHLRQLEEDGLVVRTIYPEVPPRVEYRLSPVGLSLVPVFDKMIEWGMAHRSSGNLTDKKNDSLCV